MRLSLFISEIIFGFGLFLSFRLSLILVMDFRLHRGRVSPEKYLSSFLDRLVSIRDSLKAGVFPGIEAFDRWGSGIPVEFVFPAQVIVDLRSQGAPILPSLERLIQSIGFQLETLRQCQVRSAPAKAQALLMVAMIPMLSVVLVFMFPQIQSQFVVWTLITGLSLGISAVGMFWIWKMIQKALRAGQSIENWQQIQSFISWMNSVESEVLRGVSADLAWSHSYQRVMSSTQIMGIHSQVWDEHKPENSDIRSAVISFQKSIQLSLMEGRPCLERLSTTIFDFREKVRSQVMRELEILPTRILMPLFLTLAPAVLFLLVSALWMMMEGDEWKLFV